MFKSIKKIKDKLYFLYIDKVVNNPATLKEYDKLGGLDIDDGHVSTLILENEFVFPQEVEEPTKVSVIEEVDTSLEVIDPVVEVPKKKAGRPKASGDSVPKKTSAKKSPAKKSVDDK